MWAAWVPKRIAETVVNVDTRETIRFQLLVDHAGRDGKLLIRPEQHGDASAGFCPLVHIIVDAATRLERIDEARELVVVAHNAYR